ncbi:DUF4384 domain-containing protein [Pyxidicoccus xibeiensis]|uniref:DUF4384 domain-containing protein n=1 Tax=Pyxidicoccus xibeiensis TaxID=2906759 RepID=UPI0020A7EA76|nr:DUF4384 domain-containing protein [Pyxidicoccus xibeiensis]MCP3142409.1 DUF4384 domain-containing protein [Pyxidicoccus xibeiensis]
MNDFESLRASREAGHPASQALELLAFAPADGSSSAPDVDAHVRGCEACQARVATLREERARFLQARPARAFSARVLESARRPSVWERYRLWLFGALPVAVAAAVALVLLTPGLRSERGGRPDVTFKGGTPVRLEVLVSREGQPAAPFSPGEVLRPGDVLRFRVFAPEAGHVFIANIDEAGLISTYFPASGGRSVSVHAGAQVLPGSVTLDDWTGEERITLFFSREPLEAREVELALRRAFEQAGGLGFEPPELPGQSASHVHRKAAR